MMKREMEVMIESLISKILFFQCNSIGITLFVCKYVNTIRYPQITKVIKNDNLPPSRIPVIIIVIAKISNPSGTSAPQKNKV
jgi:hypothetical protein